MADLKPCPFCGGVAELYVTKHIPHGYDYTPRCRNTSCVGRVSKKYTNRNTAIIYWNKRVGGQQLDKVTCQDCGTVFYGSPNRHFCNNCIKRRQSERAKAMNLNKIGVDAHVAKTTGRRAEDGK